jgi:hypothetical protein
MSLYLSSTVGVEALLGKGNSSWLGGNGGSTLNGIGCHTVKCGEEGHFFFIK